MSNVARTPGPWRIAPPRRGSAWRIHADNPNRAGNTGRKPGHALSFIGVASVPQSAADAALIAAAPELLEALRAMHDAAADPLLYQPEPTGRQAQALRKRALDRYLQACELSVAAISKAEGRS